MELDWTTETVDGVTLVRVRMENERAVDRRVRLRNRLDGPVLPPRRQGEPEAGWDREGLVAVVPAGSRVSRGYACPAPSEEPPVEVVAVGPPDEPTSVDPPDEPTSVGPPEGPASLSPSEETTRTEEAVGDVIRELGDARPPRAVLGEETMSGKQKLRDDDSSRPSGCDAEDAREPRPGSRIGTEQTGSPPEASIPADLKNGLTPYRSRIETVEALRLASVTEATAFLETTGGVAGVERLGEQLGDDAAALRALAVEAAALAARAEAATPPVDALRGLS